MNFFLLSIIKAAVLAAVLLTTLAYLQWLERKVIAHIKDVALRSGKPGPTSMTLLRWRMTGEDACPTKQDRQLAGYVGQASWPVLAFLLQDAGRYTS